MNKYEFYSKLLQEDFPVKYRQDFAEHDSQQCKKIRTLRLKLREIDEYLSNNKENSICSGSKLHMEIKDILDEIGK